MRDDELYRSRGRTAVQTTREQRILRRLHEVGKVEVTELAREYSVSEMTVRRDLESMESQGLCRRFHGGAEVVPHRGYELPFVLRATNNVASKAAIGGAVAASVPSGSTVFLDVGTTMLEVAKGLLDRPGITVVTPSLRVASMLADDVGLRVICLGGVARPGERSLVGSLAEQSLKNFYLDLCVLGVGGIDASAGLTEYNMEDAGTKKLVIERSQHVIVAADTTKVGTTSLNFVAPASSVTTLVSDAPEDSPPVLALQELGVVCKSVAR